MVEKLKLVLKIPKLRLGIKAAIFALTLYLLPLWVAVPVSVALYFRPTAFYLNFLGTFASFLFIVFAFLSSPLLSEGLTYMPAFIILVAATLFYAILGVKNMLFAYRSYVLLSLHLFLTTLSVWGFFSGVIPLIALIPVIFLISKDALASIASAHNRSTFFSAILSLVVTTLSWAIFYLNVSLWWATIITLLPAIGALYVIIKYFQGELFKSDAPFIAVTLTIISYALLILVVF